MANEFKSVTPYIALAHHLLDSIAEECAKSSVDPQELLFWHQMNSLIESKYDCSDVDISDVYKGLKLFKKWYL